MLYDMILYIACLLVPRTGHFGLRQEDLAANRRSHEHVLGCPALPSDLLAVTYVQSNAAQRMKCQETVSE